MPVESCQKNGKSGFRYGPTGQCYTYTTERGRLQAIEKAKKQGRAIERDKK